MSKILVASGPVIVENNTVLLDKDKREDLWKFCGGRAPEDATLIETAKKRAKEELGIDIEIIDENPFLMYVKREVDGEPTDVLLVHYLAKRIGKIAAGEKTDQWKWFELNALPDTVAPNVAPALKHFGFMK